MRTPLRIYVLRGVVALVASSAFVAIWGGWVGLGRLAGFGPVELLPGIADGFTVDLAITLPLGIEAYAAIALYMAVSGDVAGRARTFAWCSAIGALALGAFGQSAYHLLAVEDQEASAPTPVIIFVSVLPVVVLGLASVLLHLAERQAPAQHAAPVPPRHESGTTAATAPSGTGEPELDEAPFDDDPWESLPPLTLNGAARGTDGTTAANGRHDSGASQFITLAPPYPDGTQLLPQASAQGSGEDTADTREAARVAYRAARAAGRQMTGKELGESFERSERWGRDRIAECRE